MKGSSINLKCQVIRKATNYNVAMKKFGAEALFGQISPPASYRKVMDNPKILPLIVCTDTLALVTNYINQIAGRKSDIIMEHYASLMSR